MAWWWRGHRPRHHNLQQESDRAAPPTERREVSLDARELAAWAALDERPDVSVFAKWQSDEDISAFVLLDAQTPIAYGEIWLEPDERSVEFARVLVAPTHRRSPSTRRWDSRR